jgi:single-stranded-DNA-specific exonuclease
MSLSELSEIPVSQKIWNLSDPVPDDEIRTLAIEAGISQVLACLLAQRGIKSKEEALAFLNPSAAQLHNPFLMDGMEQAVQRISDALSSSHKIMIYGDYDVDGTTAVALMMRALTPVFENHVSFYIPDRYKEGYGISNEGIEHAASLGCSLIIALDCGIRSSDKVEFAKTKNIDFIICDHHLPGDTIPDASAVLDPKKPGCQYPYKE